MSKVVITADFHFGKPGRLRDCLWAARAIKEYAAHHGIHDIIVAGDLFHDRVNVNIEVAVEVTKFFDEVRQSGQQWITFPGNHDMFNKNSWDINPLLLLKEYITIINDVSCFKLCEQRFWVLPFIHYEKVYMNTLMKIEEQYQDGDILLTHIGVAGAAMNYCFLCRNWNIVNFADSKFERVYVGHFHCNQEINNKVYYPGSPIAFNFDEGMVEHGFYVLDLETKKHEFVNLIDSGIRYLNSQPPLEYRTITDEDLDTLGDVGNNTKIRVHLSREYTNDELSHIKDNVLSRGVLSIGWMKTKEEDVNINIISDDEVKLGNSIELLKSFVLLDDPTDIDYDLLLKLAEGVIETGDQLLLECDDESETSYN